jgi:hypothetical protein
MSVHPTRHPTSTSHSCLPHPPARTAITLSFQLPKGTALERTINTSWLRHNCPRNLEPSSGQKIIEDTASFAPPCRATDVAVVGSDQSSIVVTWAHDGAVSEYDSAWLAKHVLTQFPPLPTVDFAGFHEATADLTAVRDTPMATKGVLQTLSWDTVTGSDDGLHQWLEILLSDGMCLVTGAPTAEGTVVQLASAISRPQATIYGPDTFDVVSVPEPINIAYSPMGLPLHQDLVYYESPPGLQLLHCIDFADTVQGGESTLLDGMVILEEFREAHPRHFQILCTVPTLFQKVHYTRDEPVHMMYHRPLITVNGWGRITQFMWAPPFEGPLPNYGPAITAAYYEAYCELARVIDNSSATHEFRLTAGDIITFNNRRVLHGRRPFASTDRTTPRRHLQGVYVNIDEFKSKYQVLSQTARGVPSETFVAGCSPLDTVHVWNQDHI